MNQEGSWTSFYACYLLQSQKESCQQNCYIGSTPDPLRRLRQHNGEIKGGAKKTIKKRPWNMVLLVHGFPNKYAALQFEWAWQHPHLSRHLQNTQIPTEDPTTKRAFSQTSRQFITYKLVVLSEMLHLGIWKRWPLKLLFSSSNIATLYAKLDKAPPPHMSINIGSLDTIERFIEINDDLSSLTSKLEHLNLHSNNSDCIICMDKVQLTDHTSWLCCSKENCHMIAHLICLSDWFLCEEYRQASLTNAEEKEFEQLIPVCGSCPLCRVELRWGDLINDMNKRVKGNIVASIKGKNPSGNTKAFTRKHVKSSTVFSLSQVEPTVNPSIRDSEQEIILIE